MKSVAIWFFGLFACSVTGALIGEMIDPTSGAGPGALLGIVLFGLMRFYMPEQPPERTP